MSRIGVIIALGTAIQDEFDKDAKRREGVLMLEYEPQPEVFIALPLQDRPHKAWENKYTNIGKR